MNSKNSCTIMTPSINATYMLQETLLLKALYPQVVLDPVLLQNYDVTMKHILQRSSEKRIIMCTMGVGGQRLKSCDSLYL